MSSSKDRTPGPVTEAIRDAISDVDPTEVANLLSTFELYLEGIRECVKKTPMPWIQYMALSRLLDPLSRVYMWAKAQARIQKADHPKDSDADLAKGKPW